MTSTVAGSTLRRLLMGGRDVGGVVDGSGRMLSLVVGAAMAGGVTMMGCSVLDQDSSITTCDKEATLKSLQLNNKNSNTQPSSLLSSNLKKRMTLIGRFSLESETVLNPSIPTFFIGLVGSPPPVVPSLTASRFGQLWQDRGMKEQHPRFHQVVSSTLAGYLEPSSRNDDPTFQIYDTLPPMVYRTDLKQRIIACLTDPLDTTHALWRVQLFHGPLGSSGAISKHKTLGLLQQQQQQQRLRFGSSSSSRLEETVLLFRGHHALADGVSLSAAFCDLTDEALEIRTKVQEEIEMRRNRRQKGSFWQRLQRYLQFLVWCCYGSVQAIRHHLYLVWCTPNNPFDSLKAIMLLLQLVDNDQDEEADGPSRTVSWCDAAPLEQVKQVAHSMGPQLTVNDVMVSCVTYAVARQLQYHRQYLAATTLHHLNNCNKNNNNNESHQQMQQQIQQEHSTINIVIPVHLGGGVLRPGQSVGNHIGAFGACVPCEMTSSNPPNAIITKSNTSVDRLQQVHSSLSTIKQTPAPWLAYYVCQLVMSTLPVKMSSQLLIWSQAHACVAITNTRGSPRKLHLNGQAMESMAGFVPLPPKIPIGVCITSYAGTVSLSVTAEPWAVPNADQFLLWMMEEYQRLLDVSKYNQRLNR